VIHVDKQSQLHVGYPGLEEIFRVGWQMEAPVRCDVTAEGCGWP
jgi:hypothetical protein